MTGYINVKKIKSILLKKVKINNYLLIGILIFVLVGGTTIFFWPQIKQVNLFNDRNDSNVQNELAQLQEQIRLLSQESEMPVGDNNQNQSNNFETIKRLQDRIQELSTQPKQKLEIIGSSNDIYNSFIPYMVQISCLDSSGNSGSRGSGTIISPNTILTNYHVIQGYEYCMVSFTDNAGDVGAENEIGTITEFDKGRDRATIEVNHSLANKTIKKCKVEDTHKGNDLRILGYPDIGGRGNINITGGIISSFETGYIVTDAKASYGNSGGAAIHSSGCFLGIPTKFKNTGVDSFLYILDERIGSGSNDNMQSVEDSEEYQQEVIEKQEMTVKQKEDKERYDKFVSGYDAIMAKHRENKNNLHKAIKDINNKKFSYAVDLIDEYRKHLDPSPGYFNYFYDFSVFDNIGDLRKEINIMFHDMACVMQCLRDYAVYRNAENYTGASEEFDNYKECNNQLSTHEGGVEYLFNSISNTADNYFN